MNGQMMALVVFFFGIGIKCISSKHETESFDFFHFHFISYHPMFHCVSYQSFSALPFMAAEEEIPLNEVVISGKEQIYRLEMQKSEKQ